MNFWGVAGIKHPGNGPEVSVYPSLAMPRGCESTTIVETWSIMVFKPSFKPVEKKGEGTQKMAETHTIFDSFWFGVDVSWRKET